jgi:transposase
MDEGFVRTVSTASDFEKALASAQPLGQPILVDFTASWCAVCKEIDATILRDPRIKARLKTVSMIRADLAPGAHAVLLLDQAGWHMTDKLVVPANITLLPLPPKCPELNPTENVWQFLRVNYLSNRVFKSYDDIVDNCCDAWNKLVDQPWRIMSIGLRDWAHGF